MSIYGNSKQLSQSYHNISNRKGSQSIPKSPSEKHLRTEGIRKINPDKKIRKIVVNRKESKNSEGDIMSETKYECAYDRNK